MKDELLKILTNSNKDIDNQKLMNYVSMQSSESERFEIENSIADSEFLADAIEGLSKLQTNKASSLTDKLNSELRNTLRKKKPRRLKKIMVDPYLIYFAIALILILVIVGYLLIRKHLPF